LVFVPSDTNCRNCNGALPRHALACPQCHALVHSERLNRLSAEAKQFAQLGDFTAARDRWRECLTLLPAEAKQAEWIRTQIESLDIEIASGHSGRNKLAKALGPLAVIGAILAKGKTLLFALFKAKFLFSFLSFIAIYWSMYGFWYGVGFAASILVHELGHYIDVKRRGLPAEAPVFIPGLGAYVKWDALGVSEKVKAEVSLAGPLAGWVAAAFCEAMWLTTGNTLWAALARTGAWINVLNLIPVWQLDGSGAFAALGKAQRAVLLAIAVILWLVLQEGVFLLVAAGATYRLFTKDEPQEKSASVAIYFAVLLFILGLVMHSVPHHGSGLRP
jgi:Zn-dependent protease